MYHLPQQKSFSTQQVYVSNPDIRRLGAHFASISGAGIFGEVFATGPVVVLLAIKCLITRIGFINPLKYPAAC